MISKSAPSSTDLPGSLARFSRSLEEQGVPREEKQNVVAAGTGRRLLDHAAAGPDRSFLGSVCGFFYFLFCFLRYLERRGCGD